MTNGETHGGKRGVSVAGSIMQGFPWGMGRGLLRSLTLKTEGNGMLCRTRITLLVESRVWVWVPRARDTCGPRQVEADPSC
ncbi:hypothetical protein E2C01_000608 [Portunus trituberculatus]|uniref:Uncharacterized protein n=1 Tax=Portunus trituberculatus TaxID=210409 RepID=A0A5B7CF55_PORTR|nr:hypothetical protein [Portunus trituberculatus]